MQRRLVHIGIAGAVAATAIGTFVMTQVGAVPVSAPSSFISITPCRLLDTRASSTVGTRNTPLNAGESATFAVWGSNGNCTIPNTATGIATNTTVVNPTADSFLTLWPADDPKPLASNLNWTPSSPPTPNQVTVGLSAAGAVSVYNNGGTINVIIDIVGYYLPASAGPAGPPGPQGDRGYSSWDTVPYGQAMTGELLFFGSVGAGLAERYSVTLPALTRADLTDAKVQFKANAALDAGETDADCNGTVAAPTAPAGMVCIYIDNAPNITNVYGENLDSFKRSGFKIGWTTVAAGSGGINATWAYQAPSLIAAPFPVDEAVAPEDGGDGG